LYHYHNTINVTMTL